MTCGIDLTTGPAAPVVLELNISPIELVAEPSPTVLEVASSPIELEVTPQPMVLEITGVGAQGAPGGDTDEQVTAGESISALKPVVILDGEGFIASSGNVNHRGFLAGIAKTAASVGNQIVVRTRGPMQDPSWHWDITKSWMFYGNGVLTQTPPADWCQPIARVESSDTIFVDIKQGIERA